MDKGQRLESVKRQLNEAERSLGRVIYRAQENPMCFENKHRALLVKKFRRDIMALKDRKKKLLQSTN
jgi:hypothetical protein